ncbi:hypothetical protein ACQW02_18460 [Humitalea sp. 24SJ18S-53]|uniref:hypothetical protein n=1 Tax=Humitalea sp. 24SJ18S-53 TaxID=3422307 RepID=UPI003D670BD6
MNGPARTVPGASSLRSLQASLVSAPDEMLGRVLPMLDAWPDRDQVDRILQGIRPRLRRLRIPRPMRPVRLLFEPLNGAIMQPAAWRRGLPAIPRSILIPLAHLVERAAPALWGDVTAQLQGRRTVDVAAVADTGAMLWPAAAAAFDAAELPPGWSDTGLKPEDAAPLLKLAAAVLRQGHALWLAASATEPDAALLRAALLPLLAEGPGPFTAGLNLLITRSAMPGTIASVAARLDPRAHVPAELALDVFLEGCEIHPFASETAVGAAAAAHGLARLLADMEDAPAADRARRRAHLHRLRQRAAADCLARFAALMQATLLQPLLDGAEPAALEDAARGLRRLARAGAAIGEAGPYAKSLAAVIATIARRPARLPLVTAARLTEILDKPEAGLALLDAG